MSSGTLERPAVVAQQLALNGGTPAVRTDSEDMYTWPIVTPEHEEAVLEVLRRGAMSGTDVTQQFEKEFAAWQGTEYALAFSTGTAALQAAMFGCRVGVGDEIICPSVTYWASGMPALSLGGTIVFADIDENTLCIDPADIERHISPRTKAIVVVHYLGYPCDMDPIMEIANRHGIKVIEDVSHAQGGLYKGRKLGTIGHVGAMSLMSGKSFAIGEGGILVTNDREIYEYGIALGHYERYQPGKIETEALKPYVGLPLGGYKYRMHQLSSAMGRVQLKYYDEQCVEIRKAMNYFWDLLEGVPGIRAHRVDEADGSNMAGWYAAHGIYKSEELGGLSLARFCEAVAAEGGITAAGGNAPLHVHPALNDCDIYGHGKPTVIAHSDRDHRQALNDLPVSARINNEIFTIPWFKHYRPEIIEEQAAAYRKVAENYGELLAGDTNRQEVSGSAGLSASLKR